jgi:hypothetical protein
MLATVLSYYFFIKIVFFFSLVRAQIKSDLIRDHYFFLAILYTGAVAFLSYVFIVSWQNPNWAPWVVQPALSLGITPWQAWLGQTFLLSTLYFWLMAKFDEGVIFWTLLLLGLLVVLF